MALKMISSGHLATEAQVRRFRMEAEAVAHLDHPHIVPLYELGEINGQHYFTMKLIEDGSLAQRVASCRAHGPAFGCRAGAFHCRQGPAFVAGFLVQVARAVHHAHDRGILHRDLKPGNILLDAQDQPYVTDFGLAKHLDGGAALTLSGAVLGTPNYMAPEQAVGGARQATIASDVYSLGAILYELLTGHPPFEAETPLATLRQVLDREPVRPSALGRRVSRDLETICLKCLQKDPKRRYASAAELADDLERTLHGEPIHARPTSLWEQGLKWTRRKPAGAVLLAVALIAPALLTAVLLETSSRVARERNRALREEEATRRALYAADIYMVQHALEDGNLGLARRLLAAHGPLAATPAGAARGPARPSLKPPADQRGFEWHYFAALSAGGQRATLHAHTGAVTCLAFSPDGRTLLSGGEDQTLRRWDVAAQRLLETLDTAPHPAASVAFRPDDTLGMTAANQVVQWRRGDAWHRFPLPLHTGLAVFSPASNVFALMLPPYGDGSRPFTVELHAVEPPRPLRAWPGACGRAAFSHDGRALATGEGLDLKVWDLATGRARLTVTNTGALALLAFAPDDRTLAGTIVEGRLARTWRVADGAPLAEFRGHTGRLLDVAFSPDGRLLATASADQSARLWDAASGREWARRRGHQGEVTAVAFSPDGRWLASASRDHSVRLWSTALPPDQGPAAPAFPPIVLSPDGCRLAARASPDPTPGQAILWDVSTGEPALEANLEPFAPAFFTAEGQALGTLARVVRGGPLSARFFDPAGQSNSVPVTFDDSAFARRSVAASPDGRLLAVGDYDGRITLWDPATGAIRRRLTGHAGWVDALAFGPDGRTLASFSHARELRLWSVPTERVLAEWSGVPCQLGALALSPEGRLLAGGGHDNSVWLWSTTGGGAPVALPGHEEPVECLAFSSDGRTLASGSADGALKLWSVAARREMATLQREERLVFLAFTPDGRVLISASAAGRLRFWRAPRPEE